MLFSNQIAYFRKKRGLTQADIREKLYESTGKRFRQGTISFWENGKTVPSVSIMQALSQILGVSSEQLYEDEVTDATEDGIEKLSCHEFVAIAEESDDIFDSDPEKAYELLRDGYDKMFKQLETVQSDQERMQQTLRSLKDLMNL